MASTDTQCTRHISTSCQPGMHARQSYSSAGIYPSDIVDYCETRLFSGKELSELYTQHTQFK